MFYRVMRRPSPVDDWQMPQANLPIDTVALAKRPSQFTTEKINHLEIKSSYPNNAVNFMLNQQGDEQVTTPTERDETCKSKIDPMLHQLDERWRNNRRWIGAIFATWFLVALALLLNVIYPM